MKQIEIKTSERDFFRKYLEILKPVTKLSDRESDVVAEFLYSYYLYKDKIADEDYRWERVFSYEGRIEVGDRVGLDMQMLRNYLTKIRKKNIIRGNKIIDILVEYPEEEFAFFYKFSIDGRGK